MNDCTKIYHNQNHNAYHHIVPIVAQKIGSHALHVGSNFWIRATPFLVHQLQGAAGASRQTAPGGMEALPEGVKFTGDHQALSLQCVVGPGGEARILGQVWARHGSNWSPKMDPKKMSQQDERKNWTKQLDQKVDPKILWHNVSTSSNVSQRISSPGILVPIPGEGENQPLQGTAGRSQAQHSWWQIGTRNPTEIPLKLGKGWQTRTKSSHDVCYDLDPSWWQDVFGPKYREKHLWLFGFHLFPTQKKRFPNPKLKTGWNGLKILGSGRPLTQMALLFSSKFSPRTSSAVLSTVKEPMVLLLDNK